VVVSYFFNFFINFKNMKALFNLLAICFILSFSQTEAQFIVRDIDYAQKIQSSILGVVKYEVKDKNAKHFQKNPDLLKQYEDEVNTLNAFIKNVIAREWKFSGEVEYLTMAQADKILDENDKTYCLLQVEDIQNYKMNDFYRPGATSGFNSPTDWAYHMALTGHGHALVIKWGGEPKKEIVRSAFPNK